MKIALTIALAIVLSFPVSAQKGLAGLWEGVITEGGIYSTAGHRFELYLEVDGKRIKGRSYIYIGRDSIVQRALQGYFYQDRSAYLEEVDPSRIPEEEAATEQGAPPGKFTRKYQFIYSRGLEGSSLEGYWQEVAPLPFDVKRERGRIFLEKKKTKA